MASRGVDLVVSDALRRRWKRLKAGNQDLPQSEVYPGPTPTHLHVSREHAGGATPTSDDAEACW